MPIFRPSLSAALLLVVMVGRGAASEGGASTSGEQQALAGVGLTSEIGAARAIAGGRSANADRDDRAALGKFYASRQYEPVWVTATGVGPAGQALVAELARADDWGLEASAFSLPAMPVSGAELSR